jgi:hypothetical protein
VLSVVMLQNIAWVTTLQYARKGLQAAGMSGMPPMSMMNTATASWLRQPGSRMHSYGPARAAAY